MPMLGFAALMTVFPLASVILVDARGIGRDRQVALATLQAQVNAKEAKLFVVYRDEDAPWVPVLEERLGTHFGSTDFDGALQQFRKSVQGQVLYDPATQTNLATTVAGLKLAVATTRDLGLKTVVDLRAGAPVDFGIQDWLPQTDKAAVAYLDSGLPFFRDFIAQRRMFVFDLDPLNDAKQKAQIAAILGRFPAMTPVFGWSSGKYADASKGQDDVTVEHAFVEMLSQRDQFLVPADFADNLSFFAKLPAVKGLQQTRLGPARDARAYVTLIVSDGDNLQYDLNHMRAVWNDPERPKIPIGWTVSPQWAKLAPAVMDIYYREARERGGWDELVAGPSGYGYVNPGSLSATALAEFSRLTAQACQALDLQSVVTLDRRDRPVADVRRFVEAYRSAGVKTVWLADMPPHEGPGYLGEAVRLGKDGAGAARAVNAHARSHRFTFVYVHAWEVSGRVLQDFAGTLDKDVAIVSPSQMAELRRSVQ